MNTAATPEAGQSTIMALHRRYEQANAEYNLAERAEALYWHGGEQDKAARIKQALKANARECDALRMAILYQVPGDPAEAAILQFHIANAYDLEASCNGPPPERDIEALGTAIDTLFDYMCCQSTQEPSELGVTFMDGADRAYHMRMYRTGVTDSEQ